MTAGKDINVSGSNVVSSAGTTITAANNVNIAAASDEADNTFIRNEVTSGVCSGGSFGATIGKQQVENESSTVSSSVVRARLGSAEGNVLWGSEMYTGWLVDTENGLFLLEEHSPENYEHPVRIKIKNDDIMYLILSIVPALGGGQSLLFYRAKLIGDIENRTHPEIYVSKLDVEVDRGSGVYKEIDINPIKVNELVKLHGHYKFKKINPNSDWLV